MPARAESIRRSVLTGGDNVQILSMLAQHGIHMAGGVAADKQASLIDVSGVLTIDQVSAAVEG